MQVLEAEGQEIVSPDDRQGLHPLVIPLASGPGRPSQQEDAAISGDTAVTCLLRWPIASSTEVSNSSIQYAVSLWTIGMPPNTQRTLILMQIFHAALNLHCSLYAAATVAWSSERVCCAGDVCGEDESRRAGCHTACTLTQGIPDKVLSLPTDGYSCFYIASNKIDSHCIIGV